MCCKNWKLEQAQTRTTALKCDFGVSSDLHCIKNKRSLQIKDNVSMKKERADGKKVCRCTSLAKCSCRWTDRAFSNWDMDTPLLYSLDYHPHNNMCFTLEAEMCEPRANHSVWLAAGSLTPAFSPSVVTERTALVPLINPRARCTHLFQAETNGWWWKG